MLVFHLTFPFYHVALRNTLPRMTPFSMDNIPHLISVSNLHP
jgi:hypothetical protein